MLVIFAIYGLSKTSHLSGSVLQDSSLSVTLIIPFRNETLNLATLCKCIDELKYSALEVVFVDDNSEDESERIIQLKNHAYRIIKNKGEGKKEAVRTGVEIATGDILVFTDADCRFHPFWVMNLIAYFKDDTVSMVCGPVLQFQRTRFDALEYLDQLSLVAMAAGLGGVGHPVMCSAANMAIRKKEFPLNEIHGDNLSSGDDVFLLHHLKGEGKKIQFPWSKEVVVETESSGNLMNFLRRRARWGAKAGNYKDPLSLLLAMAVLLFNALLVLLLLHSAVFSAHWAITLICLAWKAGIDFLLLFLSNTKMGGGAKWMYFIPAFVFHMFYVFPVAFYGLLFKGQWKERKIN